jgi:hypothetical protein
MADELSDKVAAWLTKSGFPLEMKMAAACTSAGFDVAQGIYYVDPETSTARETDILASKEHVSAEAWMRFFVVIECKADRDAPWVLFPRLGGQLPPRDRILRLTMPRTTVPLMARLARRGDFVAAAAFASSPVPAYGVARALKEGTDHAYAAAMSVAKASAAIMEEATKNAAGEDTFDVIWPVIVTEAPLFEARLSTTNDVEVTSVERGLLGWRHPIAGRGVPAIDIVHASAVQAFLRDLNAVADLLLFNTTVEQHQVLVKRQENARKVSPPEQPGR